MERSNKHLEELSVAVHASLLTLHSLATIFHLRKKDRKWRHVVAHGAGMIYSGLSLIRHLHSLKEEK